MLAFLVRGCDTTTFFIRYFSLYRNITMLKKQRVRRLGMRLYLSIINLSRYHTCHNWDEPTLLRKLLFLCMCISEKTNHLQSLRNSRFMYGSMRNFFVDTWVGNKTGLSFKREDSEINNLFIALFYKYKKQLLKI